MIGLRDRVAVVTGALGLLGREHCHALAAADAHVVVADLDGNACMRFAEALQREHGRQALGVQLDVRSKDSITDATFAILSTFDRLDVLINNAAIDDKFENPSLAAAQSRFENYPQQMWERMLSVNLTGAFLCCQVMGPHMAARRHGSIINVASTYGLVAPQQEIYRAPGEETQFFKSAAYGVSKAGLIQLTRFVATYWGELGVRSNALCPGGVNNGQAEHFKRAYCERVPMKRMAARTDYHGAIVFLASDASSYMNGQTLVVDGGWTVW